MLAIIAIQTLLSLSFFASFVSWLSLGVYTFSLNPKSQRNVAFFLFCLSSCIWSFALSIANSAPICSTALFWLRAADICRVVAFSILLHFILLMTEQNWVLQNKWIFLLIYFPAVVYVSAFSCHNGLVMNTFNLDKTSLGWSVKLSYGFWDWFTVVLLVTYGLLSIGLIVNWGRSSKDSKNKHMAHLFAATGVICLPLLMVTDFIVNRYLSVPIPQMAPLITLIVTLVVFYSTRHYDLMKPAEKSRRMVEGKILNEFNRSRLYHYISLTYFAGSLIYIAANYFILGNPLNNVLLFSAILIIYGLLIQYINFISIKEERKDWYVFILMAYRCFLLP